MLRSSSYFMLLASFALTSLTANGIFLDGEGFYALKGETRTAPGASSETGMHQAIDQSFRLLGEGRLNEKSSVFLEFRLFDNESKAYLGDESLPQTCDKDLGCEKTSQNVSEPAYRAHTPKITRIYVRYASDFCLVEAGRRPRDWGLGLFLDAGSKPFATSHSVFDGISCLINMQKSQNMGIAFGFDKLAETGKPIDSQGLNRAKHGASLKHDDVDQIYLSIELDDRKANVSSALTKHVGIYASKIMSGDADKGGLQTDMTFIDLYTGFFFGQLALKSEVLFRLGKTADPNATRYGGARDSGDGPAINSMQSIGGTVQGEWAFGHLGSTVGPDEFGRGTASFHSVFAGFSYAPGEDGGYYSGSDDKLEAAIHKNKRKSQARAIAFHKNFSPALILFNARSELSYMGVDGIYDPSRIMNAQIFHLGYRYNDQAFGSIETKLITASLNETIPADVSAYYANKNTVPVGYYGSDLGFELDVTYKRQIGRELEFGLGAGYLIPSQGLRINQDKKPVAELLVQSSLSFNF